MRSQNPHAHTRRLGWRLGHGQESKDPDNAGSRDPGSDGNEGSEQGANTRTRIRQGLGQDRDSDKDNGNEQGLG